MKLLNFLYGITDLFVFIVLVWLFAVPNELLEKNLEDAVSRSGNGSLTISIDGLRKGMFFSIYADAVDLSIENEQALSIETFSINFSPKFLRSGKLGFLVRGKIGTGTLDGSLLLPMKGSFKINNADLDSIPYLKKFGIEINGHLSSDIQMNNEKVDMVFNVPDLNIGNPSTTVIPLINTFRRMQGSLHLDGNNLMVDSISLEGKKGYARLKGRIRNGLADMTLELMPLPNTLTSLESMVIGKYIVSPGFYSIPLNGPLAFQ